MSDDQERCLFCLYYVLSILEDQIKILKDEMVYKNILIDEQISIIKNLFTLNEKSMRNEIGIIETRPNENNLKDVNNSTLDDINNSIHQSPNNGNVVNNDLPILNSHVFKPSNTPGNDSEISDCYENYEDDDVTNFDHLVNNSWITARKKSQTIHHHNKNKEPVNYESHNRFSDLRNQHDSEKNEWNITTDIDEYNDYEYQPQYRNVNVQINRRPDIVTQDQPERNVSVKKHKRIVPGKHTFAEITTYGEKKYCVFGNSIPSRLNMKEFNKNLDKIYTYKKVFGGATAKQMKFYVGDLIENDDLDGIVINTGLNSVGNRHKFQTDVEICSDILGIVNKCHAGGIQDVYVSGLTWKEGYAKTIDTINSILKNNANLGKYTFIDNSNILKGKHMWIDNLHLNNDGLKILSKNITDAIKNSA